MSYYKDNMKAILDYMGNGDYESAIRLVDDIKNRADKEQYNLTELEPEWGIAAASLAMDKGDFEQAQQMLDQSLKADANNYEIYYMLGLCFEQLEDVENAYYNYRFALFLARGSADEAIIKQQYDNLCGYAPAEQYKLGKACEELVHNRLLFGEYEKTHAFLTEQLYDKNRTAAVLVLSEPNMLLLMMLEIVLCEKNHMSKEEFVKDNTIVRYACDVNVFNDVYRQVKLMARRVWFGASFEQQKELNDLLDNEKISPDMLAVIAKYSVTEKYWEDLFARLAAIVQYKHPQTGMAMLQYKNWITGLNIGQQAVCMEPTDYDNGAPVYTLDCADEKKIELGEDRDKSIAVVFCTNDELYESEFIKYVKRQQIPEGMVLSIIPVHNAKGMAAAYNSVIRCVDAKYKIYIHHDTFAVDRSLVARTGEMLGDESVGLVGLAGTKNLNEVAKWWQSDVSQLRMCLYQDAVLNILRSMSVSKTGDMEDVDALDGIYLATSKDVPWREDVFDGWHFYDISQAYEFRKAGYRTCAINCDDFVIMHETTMRKDPKNLYDKYREMFVGEYMG